ncbi:MAG TPA: hypothetical protein VFA18_07050 [Gemmataceae bacterium]|nr:hypothetical protein [Gemmataceae bacterium]
MLRTFRQNKPQAVSDSGAGAGNVLLGCGPNNQGLRVQVEEAQTKGHSGPIRGRFVILDAGANVHTEQLAKLLHRTTNADEVVVQIRLHHPGCVNVVNANGLTVEQPRPSHRSGPGTAPPTDYGDDV